MVDDEIGLNARIDRKQWIISLARAARVLLTPIMGKGESRMVVRPIAFGVVATLIVAAAGTGAYLAIRHNGSATTHPEPVAAGMLHRDSPGLPSHTEVELSAPAVDATEEVLDALPAEGPAGSDEARTDVPVKSRSDVETAAGQERTADRPAAIQARRADSPTAGQEPTADRPTAGQEPTADRPTAGQERTADRPTPEAATNTASPDASGRSRRADLPTVEGWIPTGTSRPSRDVEPGPQQVTIASIASSSLGVGLDREERPLIVEELIISADSVVGLQVDTPVSTEDAEVEDDVEARVTRDVVVGDYIAIPAGTRVMGSVVLVEQAGKVKGASRLGVRFHTVVLDDGVEVPLTTETVYRRGKSKGSASAGKIGGAAVGGAILGAIFGGRQGAAIGGAVGAAGGTAAAMAGDGQPATLPAGATVTVRLSRPATVAIERYPSER